MENTDNDKIIILYKELGNIWKVGEQIGKSGQFVHKYLSERNIKLKYPKFSQKEEERLLKDYLNYRERGDLKSLANEMGRTKQFICRKAKLLGLTDKENRISMKQFGEVLSEKKKEYYKNNDHPKGFLGRQHSKQAREKIGITAKTSWKDPHNFLNSETHRQNLSDKMMVNKFTGRISNGYSRAKTGTFTINGKNHFFRSSWEVNIAYYFDFQKNSGLIKDWDYESDVFWFNKIKRGVRSYKPDFKITKNDGSIYFVEVKGYMDSKSKTKLNRMRIYYPDIKLEVIDSKRYKDILKNSSLIPNWGALDNGLAHSYQECSLDDCRNKNHSKGLCRKHYYKVYRK